MSLGQFFGHLQSGRFLRLKFPREDGPQASLLPQELHATEYLSRDFEFRVQLVSDDASLELKSLIGKMVTISMVREDGGLRHFNGYVFEFSLQGVDGGLARYQMVLRPWLAFLHLRRDNFLFHQASVQDQTASIFGDYEAQDWSWRVQGADPVMTDACQFGETDYNYVHRRWEHMGVFYWYEHREDGHTLVLADDSGAQCTPIDGAPTMQWQDEAGSLDDDGIHRLVPLRVLSSNHYTSRSFDFKKPRPQQADTPSINSQGDVPRLEVYEFAGAYGFADAGAGSMLTRQRMEAIEAQGKLFEASSNERSAQPGRTFTLTGHFDFESLGASASDAEFLVVHVHHFARNNYSLGQGADQPAHYSNAFRCLRKKVPWRPGPGYNSVEPKIYGLQTALVVGPAGEEIHTDEYGRVRVQFHWDREGTFDDKSSAWVRVASTWAGSNFGFVAIPRIGQEVLVQFLDGNPDRPLITGRVYNQDNMPPWELPANKTQTGILSRSSKGGGYENANAIRFEDKKGQEEVWLHAEKDQRIEVEHDESHWVGHDRSKTIDHDETVHVKHDRTETVDHDETITVHNDRKERVDHNETISIGDNRTEDVGQNETITIGQNQTVSIGSNRSVTIGGAKTETIALAKAETIGLAKALSIGLAYQTTVGAAMNTTGALNQSAQIGMSKSTTVGKTYTIEAGDELSITVGKASLTMKSDGTITINGHTFSVGTTDAQSFNADGEITVKGKKILEN